MIDLLDSISTAMELNQISLLEFQANYDKPEYMRIFNSKFTKPEETPEYIIRARELESKLQEILDTSYRGQFKVRITDFGTFILEEVINKSETSTTYRLLKNVASNVLQELPFKYVMGGVVDRQEMLKTVSRLKVKYDLD